MQLIALGLGLVYLPLQIAAWRKWKGTWRYVSLLPSMIPLVACAVGFFKDSNLWPFWGMFTLPFATIGLGVIWGCRWIVQPKPDQTA